MGASNNDLTIIKDADERIREYRTGSITLHLIDESGETFKPGTIVHINQTQHAFLFGCNIFKFNKGRNEKENELYAQYFSDLFNFATLPFYWWGESENPLRRDKPWREDVIEWGINNQIKLKGHTLAWNWKDPNWLPNDPDKAYVLQMARIEKISNQYQDEILVWDVVNEATAYDREYPRNNAPILTEAIENVGVNQYVIDAFKAARLGSPNADFIINDFKTGRKFKNNVLDPLAKREFSLFDIIGIQSHMHNGYWGSKRIWELCNKFNEFGTPIHFTEISIVSGQKSGKRWETYPDGENKQAEHVVELYTILFSNPNVEAITWWDFSDQGTWKGAPAGLIRKDMSPKPAYFELQNLIKDKWWTSDTAAIDENGSIKIHGFYGKYNIQVLNEEKTMGGTFEIKKGHTSPIQINLK